MDATSFRQDNTETFSFHAWMRNPDLLPRSKIATFFTERAGQASSSEGPPPATAAPILPSGGDVTLLIHLAHYYDWTPQLEEDSSSSDVSGLPSSSSVASSERPYPVYKSFTWYQGVLDGNAVAHPAGPHMWDACHQPQARARHDDEPEDDGRRPAPGD
jgi:hypothetical protein